MEPSRAQNKAGNDPATSTHENLRRHGRVRCEMLESSLGTVVDLSASGMKVIYIGRRLALKQKTRKVILKSPDGPIKLSTTIVWARPLDAKRLLLGVRFDELTPELNVRLREVAAFAGVRLAIRPLDPTRQAA